MALPFTRSHAAHAPHPPTFEAIFRAHSREIMDLARRLGVPPHETEDIAQLVFMALHRAIREGRFTFEAPARPWLLKTTCLIARDHVKTLRRHGYPIELPGDFDPMDATQDAERKVELSELGDLLQELLEGLEYDHRVVFVLHEIKELTLPEIAECLDISITTARHRLREARACFEEALRRRRAADKRKYGAGAFILPLSADAILRLARTLPPEVAPGAEERVWARVKKEIGLETATYQRPRRWRALRPRAPRQESLIMTGLAFVVGALAGAMAIELLHRPAPEPRPPRDPAPVVAVVPTVEDSIPAPVAVPNATTTAPAAPQVPPSAPVDVDGEAERRCLQKVSELLAAPKPREALAELSRCEQRFPQTRFPAERAKLRREGEAALARTVL